MHKLALLIAIAAAAAVASAQSKAPSLYVGDNAPPIAVAKWAKGNPVTDLGHGKIRVVEFWATWCGPCKQSIPHLTELAKKYAGKVDFVGVDSFEHVADPTVCYPKVQKFVDGMGDKMDYHVAVDDVSGKMGKTWMDAAGQNGIPTAFIVDGNGKVAWIGHPMMGLDEAIGQILNGTYDLNAAVEKEKASVEKQKAQAEIEAAIAKYVDMAKANNPDAPSFADKLTKTTLANDPESLNELAWVLVMDNSPIKTPDYKLAVSAAEQALKLANDNAEIMDTLAHAYFKSGRFADAMNMETKAVAKASSVSDFNADELAGMKKSLDVYTQKAK